MCPNVRVTSSPLSNLYPFQRKIGQNTTRTEDQDDVVREADRAAGAGAVRLSQQLVVRGSRFYSCGTLLSELSCDKTQGRRFSPYYGFPLCRDFHAPVYKSSRYGGVASTELSIVPCDEISLAASSSTHTSLAHPRHICGASRDSALVMCSFCPHDA